MGEDRSLDEFLDSGDEQETSDEASTTESGTATDTETDESVAPDENEEETESVTPATTTYAWTGDGATCTDCGEVVERRWEQDGSLVCSECKEW